MASNPSINNFNSVRASFRIMPFSIVLFKFNLIIFSISLKSAAMRSEILADIPFRKRYRPNKGHPFVSFRINETHKPDLNQPKIRD